MLDSSGGLTTSDGTPIDWDGPKAADVRKVLDKAKHPKANASENPTHGYIVTKPRQVAYAEVYSTDPANIEAYRTTLTAAGFVVEDDQHAPHPQLVVFKRPTPVVPRGRR